MNANRPPKPRRREYIGVPAEPASERKARPATPPEDAGHTANASTPSSGTSMPSPSNTTSSSPLRHTSPPRATVHRSSNGTRETNDGPPRRQGAGDGVPARTDVVPDVSRPVVRRPERTTQTPGLKVDLRQKSAERGRARRRLLIHRTLVALVTVVGIATVVWVLLFSPLLALRADNVVVESAQSSDLDQDVIDTVVVPAVTQRVGTPLGRLSTADIRDDILASPKVLEADIQRTWPNGVRVTVRQRVPVAMVATQGGYSLVGSDGAEVTTSSEPVEGLPEVVVSATDPEKIKSQAAAAVEVWDSLPQVVREQVAVIAVNGSIVTLDLTSQAEVIWGGPEDSELKSQVLELLVEQAPAEIYDLRDPRKPVTS